MKQRGAPLHDDTRKQLVALVSRLGERGALERSGMSRNALTRALAGLPVLPGTVALIERALEAE